MYTEQPCKCRRHRRVSLTWPLLSPRISSTTVQARCHTHHFLCPRSCLFLASTSHRPAAAVSVDAAPEHTLTRVSAGTVRDEGDACGECGRVLLQVCARSPRKAAAWCAIVVLGVALFVRMQRRIACIMCTLSFDTHTGAEDHDSRGGTQKLARPLSFATSIWSMSAASVTSASVSSSRRMAALSLSCCASKA